MKFLALVPILVIVLVAGCIGQVQQTSQQPSEQPQAPSAGSEVPAAEPPAAPPSEGSQTTAPQLKEFSLTIFHTRYDPASFTVNKGDTVKISAKVAPGTESHMHGVTIDDYGINQLVTSSGTAVPIEFVADKAGTFKIYCKTCWDGPFGQGHPPIQATLTVQG